MDKAVPVWLLLLCLLLGALFTIVFGWSIKSTLSGSDRSGLFGQAALAVASFPTLARSVATEIVSDDDAHVRAPSISVDLSEFSPVNQIPGIDVQGLLIRADREALARTSGWRILVGAFTIDGEMKNAALALTPELEIANVWVLTENEIEGEEPRLPHRKLPHGFDILSDGSVIVSFDGGVSLQRFNRCGSRLWAIGGNFHHAVTLDDKEEFAWTLLGEDEPAEVVKVSTATGEISQRFSMDDIIAANPTLDILGIRQFDLDYVELGHNRRNMTQRWQDDPFHLNDVDPLPAALVDRFDGFAAGDLLLSARNLNLIFVVDPDTLEVKWWRMGAFRRQHDPDWGRTGEITIFDNRMGRDYSQIVSIAPKSFRTKILFDGRTNDFYSRGRGKHQITDTGNLIITSSQQGRVFETDPNGNVVLEIINKKTGSDEFNYVLSEVIWLPPNAFNFTEDTSCSNAVTISGF